MRILHNTGTDRVLDLVRPRLAGDTQLDVVTPPLSLCAFAELHGELSKLQRVRLVLPSAGEALVLFGAAADRAARNRLADLRNRIAFATEGDDAALEDQGIASVAATTRLAQKQFDRSLDLSDDMRTPGRLVEMVGFDDFTLLDTLTIARSRRHIEKYDGIEETGKFPDRLKPINIKSDVDSSGAFPAVRDINQEIRRLHLASYAPLRYVLPTAKQPTTRSTAPRFVVGWASSAR